MSSFRYDPAAAVAETDRGPVRGYAWHGVNIFKGIPYAAARRFHAPEPVKKWEEALDCTSFGFVCPLLSQERPRGEIYVPHRFWPADEDCLNLNIWTPGNDSKRRPVLVWLHGGGYSAGSAIEHIAYEGENMALYGDCVAVSVNHRLNVLGYLDLSAFGKEYENSGNAGGDDIIAALKWIKNNIAAFGGDPGNVTVFGQSGGGGKVTTLLQSPAADGLWHRGINMSGVLDGLMADETHSGEAFVTDLAQRLDLPGVRCLEDIPYPLLAKGYMELSREYAAAGGYTGGRPHRNRFYLGDPSQAGFRKETAHIPLMVGSVFGEFSSFQPFAFDRSLKDAEARETIGKLFGGDGTDEVCDLFRATYPERPMMDLLNLDTVFRGPEIGYIRSRSALNRSTWSYMFNQDMPVDGGRTPWHCADIPFVFRNTSFTPYTQIDGVTEKLENQIFDSVMAFARNGDPNHAGIPHWAASSPEEEVIMIFDADTRAKVNYDHTLIASAARVQAEYFKKMNEKEKARDKNIQH